MVNYLTISGLPCVAGCVANRQGTLIRYKFNKKFTIVTDLYGFCNRIEAFFVVNPVYKQSIGSDQFGLPMLYCFANAS